MEEEYLFFGIGAKVYPLSKIIEPENLFLDDYSIVSDFCFILASGYIKIGKYSRMAPYSLITGGGSVFIEDFVDISYGVKIISGSDDIFGDSLFTPSVPSSMRKIQHQNVTIQKYTFIGANSIVYPGVTIGEGAIIHPGTIVNHDLKPWSIYGGFDCRSLGNRMHKNQIIDKANSIIAR